MPDLFLMLAQENPTAAVQRWWHILLDNPLALTIVFIFLAAVVSLFLKQRRRDKCLRLLNDYHVTYLTTAGTPVWGDLIVYAQGIELVYDAPYVTRRKLIKSSSIVYEKEMPSTLALARVEHGLTEAEREDRRRQIRRTFNPGMLRGTLRWFRNILATLKDAFSKALTALIGTLIKTTRAGTSVAGQEAQVQEIGQTVLGASANAYEPILEAHIGRPVILRVASTAEPTNHPTEIPGYLVDYTEAYIAVFNTEHAPEETLELDLTETHERPNLKVELLDHDIVITNTGPDIIVVHSLTPAPAPGRGDAARETTGSDAAGSTECEGRYCKLAVPLLVGCRLTLPRHAAPGRSVRLTLERTRRIDVVAPRTLATVHFAAETEVKHGRKWFGLAPEREAERETGVAEEPVRRRRLF